MITKKISGRGRPRGFDIEKALDIAQGLFHERGYDGVGIAELSKAIGITAPSLYSAFGSKRQLFEQVLARYVVGNGGWMPQALEQEDLAEAIATLFQQAAQIYAANPKQLGCLALDGTRNCTDSKACSISASYHQAMHKLLRDRIHRQAPEQADVLANYVAMILVGLSGSARDGISQAALETSAAIAADGFEQQLV